MRSKALERYKPALSVKINMKKRPSTPPPPIALTLNYKKTKYMIFTQKRLLLKNQLKKMNLNINKNNIEQVYTFKVVQKTMTFYSLSPNCSLLLLLKSSLATNSLELM